MVPSSVPVNLSILGKPDPDARDEQLAGKTATSDMTVIRKRHKVRKIQSVA